MDFFGGGWLLAALLIFPFGYKPIVTLLSISAIFQASKMITLFGTNLPLFFCIELIAILRLIIPYRNNGFIKINNKKFMILIAFILIYYFQTFFVTNIFDNVKVYTPSKSFELNHYEGGSFLKFEMSNVSQLILMTVHLLLMYCFYARRNFISKDFYLRTVFISAIIFLLISLIWFFSRDLYVSLSSIFLNNDQYSITAIYEDRLAGTFSEPSFAGLFLASLTIPLLLYKNVKNITLFIFLCFLGFLNMSGTYLYGIIISFLILLFFSENNKLNRLFFIIPIFLIGAFISFDFFIHYFNAKAISTSGIVRSDSNLFAIKNIVETYFLGVGVGSVRTSSMILNILASFGVFLTLFLFFSIKKLINFTGSKSDRVSLFMLLICFIGSFSAIPDYTLSILWNFLFLNAVSSKDDKIKFKG